MRATSRIHCISLATALLLACSLPAQAAPAAPTVRGSAATNDTTPTWTWKTGGGGNGTFRYQLEGESGAWTQTTSTTFTPSTALSEGVHTLFVQERDAASAWSVSGSSATLVDTTAPVRPVLTAVTPTIDTTPTVTWTPGTGGIVNSASADAPKALADLATTESTLTVQQAVTIADVNVRFTITHTNDNDLIAYLVSPAGTTITLFSHVGGSGDNFTNTVLDDEAATAITAGSAPFTGTFRPTGSLADFDGESAQGTWTLRIVDSSGGDIGTLITWAIEITATGSAGNGTYRWQTQYNYPNWVETTETSWTPAAPIPHNQLGFTVQERDSAGNWSTSASRVITIDQTAQTAPEVTGTTPTTDSMPAWTWAKRTGEVMTHSSGTLNRPLADLNTTECPLAVTDRGLTIEDINVTINIRHTYDSDLSAYLVSPSGSTVTLFANVDGSGDYFTNTKFDDEATTPIASGSAPFTGTFQPQGSLADFDGEREQGNWTLRIADSAGGDVGTLVSWALEITAGSGGTGTFRYQLDSETGAWAQTTGTSWTPSTSLTDGAHTLYVQEWRPIGEWSTSGSFTITVDTTPPSAPHVTGNAATTNTTPTWTWTTAGDGGNGTFRYDFDNSGTWTQTTSTAYTPGAALSDGVYTLAVQERDAVGNWSASGTFSIEVDTSTPVAPSVNGTSPTNDATPTWTWTPGTGGVSVYTSTDVPKAIPDASTVTSTITVPVPGAITDVDVRLLIAHTYDNDLSVHLISPATTSMLLFSHLGGPGDDFAYTILDDEATAGVAAGTAPFTGAFTPQGALADCDGEDVQGTWTLQIDDGYAGDTGTLKGWELRVAAGSGGNGTYRYSLDGSGWTETSTASFAPATDLGAGVHTLDVQERDAAGNWSTSGSFPITIDLTPPAAPDVTGTTPTNDTTPTWNWSSGGGGNGTFRYSLDSGGWTVTTDTAYTPATALGEGAHTLDVQERDDVGNWSSSGSFAVTVDLTAPTAPGVSGSTPTNDETPTWSWSAGGGGNGTFRYSLDSGGWTVTTDTAFTPGVALSEAAHTLDVQERDDTGNWSASGSFAITVDTTAPATPNATGTTPTSDTTPTWSWSAAGGGNGTFRYSLDSGGWTVTTDTAYTPATALSEGAHTLDVQERDDAGNWSSSGSFVVTVDITPAAPTGLHAIAKTNGVQLEWLANAEGDLAGYHVYREEASKAFSRLTGAPITAIVYNDTAVTLDTTYRYYVTALDATGHESTASAIVEARPTELEVWAPHLIGLPGETVRIPVNITDASRIAVGPDGLDVWLAYEAALVDFTAATPVWVEATALAPRVAFSFDASTPGVLHIHAEDVAGVTSFVGAGHFVDVYLQLRAGLSVPQLTELTLTDVQVRDATGALVPVAFGEPSALEVGDACFAGDLDGNGLVTVADVYNLLNLAVGTTTADACQTRAGDLNGDRAIDAGDGVMALRLAADLPLNPVAVDAVSLGDILDPSTPVTVAVGTTRVDAGQVAVVPISVSDAQGLAGLDLTLHFPGSPALTVLSCAPADPVAGFELAFQATGNTLHVSMSAATALAQGEQELFWVFVQAPAGASAPTLCPITLDSVDLKGEYGDSFAWHTTIEMNDGAIQLGRPGNINWTVDDVVNALDVQLVINAVLGLPIGGFNADVNGDGRVDAVDVQLVMNAALGLD